MSERRGDIDPPFTERRDATWLVGDEVVSIAPIRHIPEGEHGEVIHVAQDASEIHKICIEWDCGTKMGLMWWNDCVKLVRRP
jgi:hypothetical protein